MIYHHSPNQSYDNVFLPALQTREQELLSKVWSLGLVYKVGTIQEFMAIKYPLKADRINEARFYRLKGIIEMAMRQRFIS